MKYYSGISGGADALGTTMASCQLQLRVRRMNGSSGYQMRGMYRE